jgi:branched-chain amino acid transport system ATP-binding protein
VSVGLTVHDLTAGYGGTVVLDGISLEVEAGGTLALLGRNGVGKTTLLASIMGLTTVLGGSIRLGDKPIEKMPTHLRSRAGLGYVPQEREIFPSLTVEENLGVSAQPGGWSIAAVLDLFPGLNERRANTGNRLSGGEQQMLAVGRALVGGPKVLMLDEPMEGLAPIIIETLFESLSRIRDESGLTIVLVEQKADLALNFAASAVVLDRGRIVYSDTSAALRNDTAAQERFLGVSANE